VKSADGYGAAGGGFESEPKAKKWGGGGKKDWVQLGRMAKERGGGPVAGRVQGRWRRAVLAIWLKQRGHAHGGPDGEDRGGVWAAGRLVWAGPT
jgi:hypothetical protein